LPPKFASPKIWQAKVDKGWDFFFAKHLVSQMCDVVKFWKQTMATKKAKT
jgi:hypothetical protein